MTDKEIIKALECCRPKTNRNCGNCPAYDLGDFCAAELKSKAFDLINRQQAEYEELWKERNRIYESLKETNAELEEYRKAFINAQAEIEDLKKVDIDEYASEYDNKIKAEAVKEFAEALKTYKARVGYEWDKDLYVNVEVIDSLVKEMVGEG